MPNMSILIRQDTWWVTRDHRRLRVAEMDPRHADNTAEMLQRALRAPQDGFRRFCMMEQFSDHEREIALLLHMAVEGGDMASLDAERALDEAWQKLIEQPLDEWLETTPLMKVLRARAAEGEVS